MIDMIDKSKVKIIPIPCPVVIIDDFYNNEELELIMHELNFLTPEKLLPPELTGAASDDDGRLKKENQGRFLDDLYTDRDVSNILRLNRKAFSPHIVNFLVGVHDLYLGYKYATKDNTLVSHYNDKNYYEPHRDQSLFTTLSWFYNQPKPFTGGDLILTDYDKTIECKFNRMVFMYGSLKHEVTKVKGNGRYCISNFVNMQ